MGNRERIEVVCARNTELIVHRSPPSTDIYPTTTIITNPDELIRRSRIITSDQRRMLATRERVTATAAGNTGQAASGCICYDQNCTEEEGGMISGG